MTIGTFIGFTSLGGIEEDLRWMRENDFSECQLASWEPALWTDENAAALMVLFEEYEVGISAFWCGWEGPAVWDFYDGPKTLGLLPREYREIRVRNLCEGADFARKMGIKDVITHMGFIPENPNDPEFLPFCDAVCRVASHLKENGQNLLFETGQETPVTMLRCFETVGTGNLYVNLDTANLILYGTANPVDALDTIGAYVRNLHAKDGFYPTTGHDLGKEVPIGCGKVGFPAVLRKLRDLGYDGAVTIEREISGAEQRKDILEGRAYLQGILDGLAQED